MKKTLSITIGGLVYNIEEDAYQVLDVYLSGIRAHFAADENVDELVADIESSISEKFAEKLQKRTVVGLEDVQEVIAVMGKVEEIDDNAHSTSEQKTEEPKQEEKGEEPAPKRLYRSTEDVVVAGVCSGIAAYLNVDVVFVRIAFGILTLLNGLGILLYVIFWACMPKAETPAQKLTMRGRPVNVNELQEAIKEKAAPVPTPSVFSEIMSVPKAMIQFVARGIRAVWRFTVPIVAIVSGLFIAGGSFIAIAALTVFAGVMLFNVTSANLIVDLPLHELAGNAFYQVGVVGGYLAALIPAIVGALVGLSLVMRRNLFTVAASAIMGGIWIIALTALVVGLVQLSPWMNEKIQAIENVPLVTKNFDQKDFQRIKLESIGNVTIKRGETFSIVFKGSQLAIDHLNVASTSGTLDVSTSPFEERKGLCIACRDQRLQGEITLPYLAGYEGSDASRAEIQGFEGDMTVSLHDVARMNARSLALSTLTVKLNDSSRATFEGETAQLNAELYDYARLVADQFKATNVQVVTKDISRAELWPLQSLAATSTADSHILLMNAPSSSSMVEVGNGRITTPVNDTESERYNEYREY